MSNKFLSQADRVDLKSTLRNTAVENGILSKLACPRKGTFNLITFCFQTESPLLVRPYLPSVTKSELHAIMTAGFSTIAGSVLGAYISFGVRMFGD